MGIVYTGLKNAQSEIEEITSELYADWGTFRNRDVKITENHKSGAKVYESIVSVVPKAYTGAAVTNTVGAEMKAIGSDVVLKKVEFSDTFNYVQTLDSRFEKSIKRGAFEVVSDEFDKKVMVMIKPAISQSAESMLWDGTSAAHKALVASMTPGASQGSLTASGQAAVAAMPTNTSGIISFPAFLINNTSQAKAVSPGANGIGDYRKVLTPTTITSSNIAAEYAKTFATIDPKVYATGRLKWYAPLSHKQFAMISDNAIGAAINKNFSFVGDKVYYQGIEMIFKPMSSAFHIVCDPDYLNLLMDLQSDLSKLEVGKDIPSSDEYYYKNVVAMDTFATNQRYIVLYGG